MVRAPAFRSPLRRFPLTIDVQFAQVMKISPKPVYDALTLPLSTGIRFQVAFLTLFIGRRIYWMSRLSGYSCGGLSLLPLAINIISAPQVCSLFQPAILINNLRSLLPFPGG